MQNDELVKIARDILEGTYVEAASAAELKKDAAREAYGKKMLAGAKSNKLKSFTLSTARNLLLVIDDKHNAIAVNKDGSYLSDYISVRGIPLGADNRFGSLQSPTRQEAEKILSDLGYEKIGMFDVATPPKSTGGAGSFILKGNNAIDSDKSLLSFNSRRSSDDGQFIFKIGRSEYKVDSYYHSGKIYADIDNRSDQTWPSLGEFVKFLNANDAKYIGFDRGDN